MSDTITYNIFYTDDDSDDLDIFREIVAEINEDIYIFTQNNGEELIALLQNPPPRPRIIFLDLNMPVKNGYEVLKEIRQVEKTRHLPIIIFSTSCDDESIARTKRLGATMYVSKPQSYHKLKEVLRKILSIDWTSQQVSPEKYLYRDNVAIS